MKRNKLIKQCVTLGILSLLAIVVSIICVISSVGSYWAGDTGLGMMIVAIVLGVLTLVAFGIFDYVLIEDYVKEYKDGAEENDSGDIQSLNQFCNQMRIEEDSIEAVKKLDEAIATAENVTEAIEKRSEKSYLVKPVSVGTEKDDTRKIIFEEITQEEWDEEPSYGVATVELQGIKFKMKINPFNQDLVNTLMAMCYFCPDNTKLHIGVLTFDGEEKVIDTTAMMEEAVEAMSDVANAAGVASEELTAMAEAMADVVAGDTTLVESESKDAIEVKPTEEAPAKKKRGRPRKKPVDEVKE